MQVFKLFFKIFRSQLGQVIMYIAIFAAIASLISGQNSSDPVTDFVNDSQKITIVDEDNTTASKAFKEQMSIGNKLVTLDSYDEETMQDELYDRNTSNIIFIPAGFEKAIINGETESVIKIYNIPGTMASNIITSQTDNYINTLSAYAASGMSIEDAAKNTTDTLKKEADITISTKTEVKYASLASYLTCIAYVFVCIAITGISPIIMMMNKTEIRKRFNCSSYKLGKSSFETALASALIGAVICGIFFLLAYMSKGSDMLTREGALATLNMAVYMIVSLSLAYLIGVIANSNNMIGMMANIIGLALSFLGGVFVPLDFLGEGIIKIAHFLPSYWYIITNRAIFGIEGEMEMSVIAKNLGIELLFPIAIFLIALAIQRNKRTAA